jgi:signal peptidase II
MRLLWVSALIVLVDQFTKMWVRTTMFVGESIPVLGSWLRFTFTENSGMAFGLQLTSTSIITGFSVVATGLIIVYLWQMRRAPVGYRLSIAVVLGGAVGNIIDRVFYGKLFSYGSYFNGHVVDFIHVDLWRGIVADWIPFLGGQPMALFPIWNVADMAIVLGVVGMLVAQYSLDRQEARESGDSPTDESALESSVRGETAGDHSSAEPSAPSFAPPQVDKRSGPS